MNFIIALSEARNGMYKMKEIDLIIEENGVLHPIEIKKSSVPDKNATKSFLC